MYIKEQILREGVDLGFADSNAFSYFIIHRNLCQAVLEVKGNGIGCGVARPHSIHQVEFMELFSSGLVITHIKSIPSPRGISGVHNYQFVLACVVPIESLIGCPGNRTIPGNRCGKGIFLPLIIARNPAEVERVACFPFKVACIEADHDLHCTTSGTNVVFDGVGSACLLITTHGAGRLMGAVAVVGVGVAMIRVLQHRSLGLSGIGVYCLAVHEEIVIRRQQENIADIVCSGVRIIGIQYNIQTGFGDRRIGQIKNAAIHAAQSIVQRNTAANNDFRTFIISGHKNIDGTGTGNC